MQNPSLIAEISDLVKSNEAGGPAEPEMQVSEEKKDEAEKVMATEKPSVPIKRARRKELLNAMKPYLSENRRSAIDSMSSILDILDVMVKKES